MNKKIQEQSKPEEKIKLIMTVPITQVEEVVSNPPVVFPPNIITIYGDANLFSNWSICRYSVGISNKTSKIRKTKLPETQIEEGVSFAKK